MQPGDTINPSGSQLEPAKNEPQQEVQINHDSAPQSEPVSSPPEPTPLPAPTPPETEPEFESIEQTAEIPELTWTASEFIEHQKPQGWYMTVAVGATVLSAVLYLIVQDIVTVVVVAIAAIMFGVVGSRKPRSLNYSLSQHGIRIGDKEFPYDKFKSFSVIEEGAIDSVQLLPLQRFAPPISLYFPPEQEDEITNILGSYLPHEDRSHDPIDRLMKRLHF